MIPAHQTLGAVWHGQDRCSFRIWAPKVEHIEVRLITPTERLIPLQKESYGYHSALVNDIPCGSDYLIRFDGKTEHPDPASRWQPKGVHGPSRIVDPEFAWKDTGWFGPLLRDYIIYELHVGAFSEEGTFDGVIAQLPELKRLGITAIELMPVAQFPGERNWGYDGVYPFAVQNSYGGPEGLRRLVNAAHQEGLAVVLDVVYNHLGPEGNYLSHYAPYFTTRYCTPWGRALNFDGPYSREVRHYFIENALYWQSEFHIDALRLDAVHAILDFSSVPFLEQLAQAVHRQAEELNRRFYVIAESDLNMARHILPRSLGGYGLDAQWSDDFHHALHVLLTGERSGYYSDFGGINCMAKVFHKGYAYTGEYSSYRHHLHGSSPRNLTVRQFVVCSQNHDQVGNRMLGDRLSASLSLEKLKLAAGAVLLSPFVPLLFMGEEYGETAPFQYFVSHSDPALVEAVQKGRRAEFESFKWQGEVPDPQSEATFLRSKLSRTLKKTLPHSLLREFYGELIRLRKGIAALVEVEKEAMEVRQYEAEQVMLISYAYQDDMLAVAFNFSDQPRQLTFALSPGTWRKRIDSAAKRWNGPGSELPDEIVCNGPVTVNLSPTSVAALHKT